MPVHQAGRGSVDGTRLAHVAESCSVVDLVKEQKSREGVVQYLNDFELLGTDSVFAHCVHLTSSEIELRARSGTSVSHNPVSNMMLGDGVAPVVAMLERGVNIALGTDGAASNHGQDMFELWCLSEPETCDLDAE